MISWLTRTTIDSYILDRYQAHVNKVAYLSLWFGHGKVDITVFIRNRHGLSPTCLIGLFYLLLSALCDCKCKIIFFCQRNKLSWWPVMLLEQVSVENIYFLKEKCTEFISLSQKWTQKHRNNCFQHRDFILCRISGDKISHVWGQLQIRYSVKLHVIKIIWCDVISTYLQLKMTAENTKAYLYKLRLWIPFAFLPKYAGCAKIYRH